MNIAYISADFGVPVFGYKGASVHVREMVTAFCKAGHTVSIISPAIEKAEAESGRNEAWKKSEEYISLLPTSPTEPYLQLNKELEKLDDFLGMKTRIRQELRNLLYNLTVYEKIRERLEAHRVDFIYERYTLFSYAGIRLARTLGVPHILEVNAPLAYEQEKTRGLEMKELAAEMERRIFRDAGRVIVVSKQLQEFVAACGVPASRIHILPNGVDALRFANARDDMSVRRQYQLEGKRVIGFVGSLKPWHGTETLLEAFRAVQATVANAHLLIVGDGPGREHLENHAQASNLNGAVTFTGNVPYDEIPRYIGAMDIAVAPYTPNGNFYYSPIKIFEYMAMGKPVVAGKIGQVEEIIHDEETGALFEPGNTDQLKATLIKLVNDSQSCRRLGANARAWVEKERTWEGNAQQVIEIVNELLQQKG